MKAASCKVPPPADLGVAVVGTGRDAWFAGRLSPGGLGRLPRWSPGGLGEGPRHVSFVVLCWLLVRVALLVLYCHVTVFVSKYILHCTALRCTIL